MSNKHQQIASINFHNYKNIPAPKKISVKPELRIEKIAPSMQDEKDKIDGLENRCFCNSLSPILLTCKFFGFLPLSWYHDEHDQCRYKPSYPWLVISGILTILYLIHFCVGTEILHFNKNKPLPELLTDINDIVYTVFVAILTFLSAIRYPRFVKTFNKLIPIVRNAGLACPSSLSTLRKIQFGYLGLFFGELAFEYAILIWLHYSDSYTTNFNYAIFVNTVLQNLPFVFYLIFFLACSSFISILGCFEKLVIDAIKFTPVHPLNDIDETNNRRDFIGLIKYEVCRQEHKCFGKMLLLTQPELIEYLRSLHEDVSLVMYDINSCLNPQLLFHTIVELTVLIVHWYEVIIYTSYTFSTPLAGTINILNWIFVISHTIGLFLFLKSAQELKNMIHGLTNFLLEYSTRISSPEEHQQIRIFIEKLEQHHPITASGVFTIDLGIAGPISANILTYVLVALQFDVPKN